MNARPATPIDPQQLVPYAISGYPEPFAAKVLPREKLELGDASGLTKLGVNLTTLWPGAASSMRHWHTHEDELVYVIEGGLMLVTDAGERVLRAGIAREIHAQGRPALLTLAAAGPGALPRFIGCLSPSGVLSMR